MNTFSERYAQLMLQEASRLHCRLLSYLILGIFLIPMILLIPVIST